MAKTKISEYSATASSNTDINSINLAEGMAPSLVNNAIRQLMAQLKDFQVGTAGDNVTVGGNLAVTGTSAFTGAISAPMTAGTIDGVPIGGTTPAAGAFTTLAASGTTTLAGALVGAVTQAAFNTTSTTLNLGGAATAVNIGAATGTATVANTTLAAKAITASTTLAVTGASTLTGAVTASSTLAVTGAATLSSTLAVTGHATLEGVTTTGATGTGKLVFDTSGTVTLTSGSVATTPTAGTDIANKLYVDTVAQGLNTKASVINASTVALTATYANGTLGVGATLTNSGTNVAFLADGISNSVSDRVLIKDQASTFQNGIYTVTTVGSVSVPWVLTRATDNDTWAEVPSGYVFISTGTTLADTGWVCSSDAGGTMGTTAITWSQFGGVGGLSSINFGTTGLTPATPSSGAVTVAGTLAVANGGTNITSYAVGDIIYASTTGVLSKLADIATGNALISGGVGTAPSYGKIDLTTHVSGTLPIANGGTNSTATATAGGVNYGTGTAHAYTAASTSGYILTSGGAGAPTFIQTLPAANGGTGVANNAAMTVTGSGNFAYTRTLTGTTNVTFPTTGTLSTLAGTETLTNKTLTNPTVTNYVESVVAIGNSGTTQTLSLTSGTVQTVTMTGNCTFTMPTATAGKSFILICTQDGTGGRTATFTSVKFPAGTAPTLTTTATTGVDILTFVANGTSWFGTYAQAFA